MITGSGFLDRLIERMDRLDPSSLQTYVLRLARQKGFLETVFNTIEEGVIVIDHALHIRYINSAAQHLLGIQEEAGNQRIDRYLREVGWQSLLDADPENWDRISRQEIEVFYPHHRHLSFYLVPIRIGDEATKGHIPLATIILRDVSQARVATEKVIESQRVQAIVMLAAGVAHELGNPLNSLNIHLQLLARCLRRLNDAEVAAEAADLLDIATQEVKRLDSIVKNFLHAIRPVAPKLKRVLVQNVVAESLAFMRAEIENRKIRVEASWSEGLPAIMADADQLKQAFYNIIKNAVQAMPDGGLLRIDCASTDEFVTICFADSGKGISAEQMRHIMDPYFTTSPDGTGLGLLIVDRIVRSHGGELGISSDEQQGTAFTIHLPLQERRVRLLNAASGPEQKHRGDDA